jgi:hypothetical protein
VYSRHETASTNDGLLEISKMKYRIPEQLFPVLPIVKKKKNHCTAKKKYVFMVTCQKNLGSVGINFFYIFFLLLAKPEIVVSGIRFRYFILFAYLLIFIYVTCCLISSNVLFIQPLAFGRN